MYEIIAKNIERRAVKRFHHQIYQLFAVYDEKFDIILYKPKKERIEK